MFTEKLFATLAGIVTILYRLFLVMGYTLSILYFYSLSKEVFAW